MTHITNREAWGTVDVDFQRGHVFVREDWRYEWTTRGVVEPWSPDEQGRYHSAVDHLVWAHWSLRARIWVSAAPGSNGAGQDLVRNRGGAGLTLSFDVRRVQTEAQWTALVTKVNPAVRPIPRPRVWFEARKLERFTTDIVPHRASRFEDDPRARRKFSATAHEFGHTLGYVYSRGNGEEREPQHRYFRDTASIMNIGRTVRPRHLALVTETLAKMVPGCRFSATVTS